MKNAFLILAHTDPTQLYRLAKALDYKCDVYVHLDAKADLHDFDQLRNLPHVRFIEPRHRVSWAGISMVSALLALMEAAIASQVPYGHVVLLTGADYPIKSAMQIHQTLQVAAGRELITLCDVRPSARYTRLLKRMHLREPLIRSRNPVLSTADRALRKAVSLAGLPNRWPQHMVPYRGHTWCALSMACCRYVVDFHHRNPWYYQANRRTMAPDEHYFHTIIGNSRFAKAALEGTCVGGLVVMTSTHLIDVSLVKWFTLADWPQIAASDRLFVRKVRTLDGTALLDRIDECILGTSTRPMHTPRAGAETAAA